jgi:hypothetical protein
MQHSLESEGFMQEQPKALFEKATGCLVSDFGSVTLIGSQAFDVASADADFDFLVGLKPDSPTLQKNFEVNGAKVQVNFRSQDNLVENLQRGCVSEVFACFVPDHCILSGPRLPFQRSYLKSKSVVAVLKNATALDGHRLQKRFLWVNMYMRLYSTIPSPADFQKVYQEVWKTCSSDDDASLRSRLSSVELPCDQCQKNVPWKTLEEGICCQHVVVAYDSENSAPPFPQRVIFLQKSFFQNGGKFLRHDQLLERNDGTWAFWHKERPLISITHVWESAAKPDVLGYQFRTVCNVLKAYGAEDYQVFYDYSSLPQKSSAEARKNENGAFNECNRKVFPWEPKAVFNEALAQVNLTRLFDGTLGLTRVIDVNVVQSALKRSWPCFELTISWLFGTLVDERICPDLVRLLQMFQKIVSSKKFTGQDLWVWKKYRSYFSARELLFWMRDLEEHLHQEFLSMTPENIALHFQTAIHRMSTPWTHLISFAAQNKELIWRGLEDHERANIWVPCPDGIYDQILAQFPNLFITCFVHEILLSTDVTCPSDKQKIVDAILAKSEDVKHILWKPSSIK